MPTETIGENTTDDYSGCEDVSIYDASNHDGGSIFLTTPNYNGLIKFSGLSNISGTVNGATVYFYPSYANGLSATVRRLLLNWVETEATSVVYSTGNNWTGTSGSSVGNDVSSTSSGTFSPGNTTGSYVSFTSAQFVQDNDDFVNSVYPNYGHNLICTAGGWIATDSEGTDGQRPYLEIDYTAGGGDTGTFSDGFEFSDSLSAIASSNCSLTDSFIFSDTLENQAAANNSLSDEFTFSDSESNAAAANQSLSDGMVFSDSESSKAAALSSFSDVIVLGDTLSEKAAAISAMIDGFELSESSSEAAAAIAQLIDGLTFADSASLATGDAMTMTDGMVWSDSFGSIASVILSLSDGFTLSDAYSQIRNRIMSLSDSFILSDNLGAVAGTSNQGVLKVTAMVKSFQIDFIVKKPVIETEIKQLQIDTEIN